MAINLKAKETLIQVGEMKGQYRFILGTELYNKLSEQGYQGGCHQKRR